MRERAPPSSRRSFSAWTLAIFTVSCSLGNVSLPEDCPCGGGYECRDGKCVSPTGSGGDGGGASCSEPPTTPACVTDGLVAYFPLDGDYTDALRGVMGSAVGNPNFIEDPDRGTVLAFERSDGEPDNVVLDEDAVLDGLADASLSISAWVRVLTQPPAAPADTPGAEKEAIESYLFVHKIGFTLGLGWRRSDRIRMSYADAMQTTYVATDIGFTVDRWYHVIGVVDRDANEVRLYVDGAIRATVPFTEGIGPYNGYATMPWRFGGGGRLGVDPIDPALFGANGYLDDVRFYDRVLTEDDIIALASD